MKKRGFTLIEVLVVIAVIAVIAAILLPVFSAAKASAKDTQSSSQLSQIGKAIHLYSVDHDDCFPFASNYFDTMSVRLGVMPPDSFGRWSSIPTIKDLLAVYRMPDSVWVSQSDPGELTEPNPLPEEHRMSYQYLLSNPCTGALGSIEEPSRSSFIRERGPFRRGQALNFRVDGSTKILSWKESGDEAERFRQTYKCHEQSLLHR